MGLKLLLDKINIIANLSLGEENTLGSGQPFDNFFEVGQISF